MLASEGLLVALEAVVSKPLLLALYTNELKASDPTQGDFKLAQDTGQRHTVRDDWHIDPDQVLAAMEHVFTFKGASKAMYHGWVVMTREERAVIMCDAFAKPYPVNSAKDSITVSPRLKFRRL